MRSLTIGIVGVQYTRIRQGAQEKNYRLIAYNSF